MGGEDEADKPGRAEFSQLQKQLILHTPSLCLPSGFWIAVQGFKSLRSPDLCSFAIPQLQKLKHLHTNLVLALPRHQLCDLTLAWSSCSFVIYADLQKERVGLFLALTCLTKEAEVELHRSFLLEMVMHYQGAWVTRVVLHSGGFKRDACARILPQTN